MNINNWMLKVKKIKFEKYLNKLYGANQSGNKLLARKRQEKSSIHLRNLQMCQ